MPRRLAEDRSINLRRAVLGPGDEVLELDPTAPPSAPPLRIFADLPGPPEAEYAPPPPDPVGLASLWRAVESL
jgi:hypothetical protein